MCLFAAVFQTLPDVRWLVLANRDERRGRPWRPPQIMTDPAGPIPWMGGLDLQAGGTWLGVNARGLLVAVTNRSKRQVPLQPRSRGRLCRDLLANTTVDEALQHAERQLREHPFAGFDLILLSPTDGAVVEAADETAVEHLEPGIHLITNGALNDAEDAQIRRVREELDRLLVRPLRLEEWVREAMRIGSLRADGDQPAVCITGEEWGTVSSTVMALTATTDEARYHFAPGPPAEVPYDDYSPAFRQLLRRTEATDSL